MGEMRKTVGSKRSRSDRKQQTRQKGFHGFHSSPNIFRLVKLRRMRWAEHVARTGQKRFGYANHMEGDNLEDIRVDGGTIKWGILKRGRGGME